MSEPEEWMRFRHIKPATKPELKVMSSVPDIQPVKETATGMKNKFVAFQDKLRERLPGLIDYDKKIEEEFNKNKNKYDWWK